MPARREKLHIEVFPPKGDPAAVESRIDATVLRLARLIGRQMAREEFERQQLENQRCAKRRPDGC